MKCCFVRGKVCPCPINGSSSSLPIITTTWTDSLSDLKNQPFELNEQKDQKEIRRDFDNEVKYFPTIICCCLRDNEKSMERKFINGLFDLTDFHTTEIRLVKIICWNRLLFTFEWSCHSWLIVIKNDLTFRFVFFSFAHRKIILINIRLFSFHFHSLLQCPRLWTRSA